MIRKKCATWMTLTYGILSLEKVYEVLFYTKKGDIEMKKVLIICAAGMSSSMMAAKTTQWFKDNGKDIFMDAVSATEGQKMIDNSDFDLFLVSPQTKMYYAKLKAAGERAGKPVVEIPPQAYVPIPSGIEKMADLVMNELPL